MFDPTKYDSLDNNESVKKGKPFPQKRREMIAAFEKCVPLINKECEMLEEFMQRNPGGGEDSPFNKKLVGWSRILNGINMITQLYANDKGL